MSTDQREREPINILLVEDDPEAVRTIWNMLREKSVYKYSVVAVTRLAAALSHLMTHKVDIVLLDLILTSHLAENEAIEVVKAAQPAAAVIILTTLEDEKAGLHALGLGAQDYLLKEEIGTRHLTRALHYAVERKRLEETLRVSEENYRLFAELNPDAIFVNLDDMCVYANTAALNLMGTEDASMLVGRSSLAFIDSADPEDARQQVSATLKESAASTTPSEYRWRRLDGSSVQVEVTTHAIVWNGGQAALLYVRNITGQKEIEQQQAGLLLQEHTARREAERAVAMQRLFLGMISHELRTPLTSIKGFATSILATDVTFKLEEIREFIKIINEEADRLSNLIGQLLDMVQVEAGILRVQPREVTAHEIIDTVMPQLQILAAQHRLEVMVMDNLPMVVADVQRVGQVLVNLVGNAVKFSPPDTPITLTVSGSSGDHLQFNVSDAGEGIPPAERQKVFDVFHQVIVEGRVKNGSGLGLAICKGLVEVHGGTIWVADETGQGTTVSFTLPTATNPAD